MALNNGVKKHNPDVIQAIDYKVSNYIQKGILRRGVNSY